MFWWIPLLLGGVLAALTANGLLSPADMTKVSDYAPFAGAVVATIVTAVMGYLVAQLRETRHAAFGQTLRKQRRNSSAIAVPLRRSIIVLVSVAIIAACLLLLGFFKGLLSAEMQVWAVSAVVGAITYSVLAAALLGYWYYRVDHLRQQMQEKDAKAERRRKHIEELRQSRPRSSDNGPMNPPPRIQGQIRGNGV